MAWVAGSNFYFLIWPNMPTFHFCNDKLKWLGWYTYDCSNQSYLGSINWILGCDEFSTHSHIFSVHDIYWPKYLWGWIYKCYIHINKRSNCFVPALTLYVRLALCVLATGWSSLTWWTDYTKINIFYETIHRDSMKESA